MNDETINQKSAQMALESLEGSIDGVQHALEVMAFHDECDARLVRILANELNRCRRDLDELREALGAMGGER